jgi:hypothetical protein
VSLAFSVVSFFASAPLLAYVSDWFGVRIAPLAVLAAAALIGWWTFAATRRAVDSFRHESIAFVAISSTVFGWLLWLARPSFLPLGSGPDLTHHLALIDFIERCWCLPHDPNLAAALGEMANYTPGVHLLAALAGAWIGSDGFHTLYTVVALTVALKCGIIFLVARRMMPAGVATTACALAAVLFLFGPRHYFLGAFTEASYFAQIASELFAVAMWLAIVVWEDHPSLVWSGLIGVFGAAVFLTWPVALGPLLLLAATVMAIRASRPITERARHLAAPVLLPAIVAVLHAYGRRGSAAIVAGAGYVVYPGVELFGWWFLIATGIGVIVAALHRRSRTVPLLLAAIAMQSGTLLFLANRSGAARPYMALKMVYLAIYPLAVAGSLAIGHAAAGLAHLAAFSQVRGADRAAAPQKVFNAVAVTWAGVALFAYGAVRSAIKLPRARPAVSESLFQAGKWARANLKPDCVDYVVDDVYAAYWLHIAVLRNGRAAPRSTDDDTYLPEKERIRWVLPEGLPYAIAQDFDQLPKDIRANVEVVARFGPDAVIKRKGPAINCGA